MKNGLYSWGVDELYPYTVQPDPLRHGNWKVYNLLSPHKCDGEETFTSYVEANEYAWDVKREKGD